MTVRVVVAGGTGFIGRATAAALAERHDVVALGLPGEAAPGPEGAEVVHADVLDPGLDLDALLRPADALVTMVAPRQRSAAAVGTAMRSLAERMGGAAARAGVARLVHVSNPSVFAGGDGWVDDDTPPAPGYPLGHDTLATERLIAGAAGAGGTACTVLRVAAAFDRDPAGRLLGVPPTYVEPGDQWQSFVSVGDVAAAVALALDGRLPATCTVADGHPVTARAAALAAADDAGAGAGGVRAIPRSRARRYGPNPFGMMTTSLRLRPGALRRAGWSPTDRLAPAATVTEALR